ncbi:histidinol-phosphate transaminase [Chloroflexota bacterium]
MSEDKGIERLIRKDLVSFGGYSARKAPETLQGKVEIPVTDIIKLDANENPYGCSPRIGPALAGFTQMNVYPDNGQTQLRKLLQGYTGAGKERIVAGSGSNQLIDLVLRLFIEPGDEVINCVPSFALYRFSTKLCSARLIEVPRDENFNVDTGALKAAVTSRTKMILLDSPNNPTGSVIPAKQMAEILDTGLPVLIDEAYGEFSGETAAPLINRYQNLMVLRTFSKWAGLAGLRAGYGIFPPGIAEYLLKIKLPYNVNIAALVAIRESLADLDYLMANVRAIVTERERLFGELAKIKFLKPYPSRANFILCSVADGKADELRQKLEEQGILVRYFDTPLLSNFIRISVGKPEHTDALVRVLRKIGGS